MSIREVLVAVLGAAVGFLALLGGALFLLKMDFFAFRSQPTELDCTDPNSKLCHLRNFFRARSQSDGVEGVCIRSGLPADCADL